MKQSTCQYCNKAISKQNMRKHQKTQTCKKFQVPVLSDFDKEIMRLCEEREPEFNSDYESDSDDSQVAICVECGCSTQGRKIRSLWNNVLCERCGEYSDSDIEDEYAVVFGYDMLDTGGILQLKAKIRERDIVAEDERLLQLKETNQIPSRNWKHGLVLMSRYDSDDETICHSNCELLLMGGYASDSSHDSYHGDGLWSTFSRTTQMHSNFTHD
jgi:hypothetical protein